LNSEIITDTEYSSVRDCGRQSRRKRGGGFLKFLIPAVLLAAVLAGIFFVMHSGLLLKNRYLLSTSAGPLLRDQAPAASLKTFGADLSVITHTEDDDPSVQAHSVILCREGAAEAVYAKHALERMNPASITKVMTCLLALENADFTENWTAGQEIYVSDKDASMAGIKEGDSLTAEQVVYGLMLRSGADAANMIALHIGGGETGFVEMMNRRAAEIGCAGTHFTNTHGLTDPQHYTTAYDIYLILREAMKDPRFREISGCVEYQADYTDIAGQPKTQKWKNTNYFLIGRAPLPEGVKIAAGKTGTTLAAGNCLALVSENPAGELFYSVTLKSPKRDILYTDAAAVLEKTIEQH